MGLFKRTRGLPILTDEKAESDTDSLPAFLSRPTDAPVYHGFPILDIEVEGFRLGAITDYVGAEYGDGFVIAPDGSRAGLVWQIADEAVFIEAASPKPDRWGVWEVSFPEVMTCDEDVRASFAVIVPALRAQWEA